MSRSARLLDLIQLLRSHRRPVSGQVLATSLGISLRTLYRDIATLQSQGAVIEGEPGVGYVLRAGYMLPPLMFTEEEIEALVLGSRWVAERSDSGLELRRRRPLRRSPPSFRRTSGTGSTDRLCWSGRVRNSAAVVPSLR